MELLFTILLMLLSAIIGFLTCGLLSSNKKGVRELSTITFNKGIDIITIEDCINCNNNGIDVIMNEGKEVTFQIN